MHDDQKPFFLITIDTEGDNLWEPQRDITVENARFIPRFQTLCEKYGLKPVYLTDYEMACSEFFQDFGKDVVRRGVAEIGMHLHAWNTPPDHPLTYDDMATRPYLIEYPSHIIRKKIDYLTKFLQDIFQIPIVSHRAGRWAFNNFYAQCLAAQKYRVDCSVTPLISWELQKGDPSKKGGSQYVRFPHHAYFVDLNDISRPGNSKLLEVPLTVISQRPKTRAFMPLWMFRYRYTAMLVHYVCPVAWLRPNGRNVNQMIGILDVALQEKRDYVEFMLHSSELMPGGSPTFRTENDISQLYDHLEMLFGKASNSFRGGTLAEFFEWFSGRRSSISQIRL